MPKSILEKLEEVMMGKKEAPNAISNLWSRDYQRGFNQARKQCIDSLPEVMRVLFGELNIYILHTSKCILSFLEEGEPRDDGSYWNKYKGKWYQSSPIDNNPKCDCGLDDILSLLTTKK